MSPRPDARRPCRPPRPRPTRGLTASRQSRAPRQPSSMTWPGPQVAPGVTTLRARISQRSMPAASASRSSRPSVANWAWLAPKPRKAPHTGLLVRTAHGLDVDHGPGVGPAGVAGRPLEHLHPHRRVRPRVADDAGLERGDAPVGVAPGPRLDAHRVALGVDVQRLLPAERALHRPAEQPGGQRGLGLVGAVLLAAEGAAVGDEVDEHPVLGDAEDVGDLAAVVPHALPAREHLQRAVVAGHGQRRLGLEEGVLDALGLEHLVDGVGAGGQRGVGVEPVGVVAAGVGRAGQDVGRPGSPTSHTAGSVGVERGQGVGERGERLVVDLHQLGGPAGRGPVARPRRGRARRRCTTCARRPG